MNYYGYKAKGQMTLSDRIAIETGICCGDSFKRIAKRLKRHPSTIAHEVKETPFLCLLRCFRQWPDSNLYFFHRSDCRL